MRKENNEKGHENIKTREGDEQNDDQVNRNDDDSDDEQSNSTNNISNIIESDKKGSHHSLRDANVSVMSDNNNKELLNENNCFEDYKSDIQAMLEHIFVIGNEKRFWYGRVKKAGSYKTPFLFYNPTTNKKVKSNPTTTEEVEENSRRIVNTNTDMIWIRQYVMEQLQLYQNDQKYNTKSYMKSLALVITNCIIRARSILCNNEVSNNVLNRLQNINHDAEDTQCENSSMQIQLFFLQYSRNILNMEKQRKFSTTGIPSQKQQQLVVKRDDDNRKSLDDDNDDIEVEEIEMLGKQEKSMNQEKKQMQQQNLQKQPMIVSNYDELFVDIQAKALIHVYNRIMLEKTKHAADDKTYDNEGIITGNSSADTDNYHLINDRKRSPSNGQRKVLIHSSDIGLYEESVNVGFEQLPWPIPRKRKNMFGDGYRYHHTYTDDIDMNTNPITFSKEHLSLLPAQRRDDYNGVNLKSRSVPENSIDGNNIGKKIRYSDTNPEKEQQVDDDPHLIEKMYPNRGLLLHCWQRAIHAASSSIHVSVSSKTTTTTDPSEGSYTSFQREEHLASNDNTNRSNPLSPNNDQMEFITHYENMKRDISYCQLICQRLGLTLNSFFQKSCDDENETGETEQSSSNKNEDGTQHDNDDDSSIIIISEKRRKTRSSTSSQKQENTEEETDGKQDTTMKLEQQVKESTGTMKYACPACSIEFHTQSRLHNHYYGMNQNTETTTTDNNDIRTINFIVGCCWTLIEQTRCKQIEGLLQREVDVQLKQLLQLIFVNTLVTQYENNQEDDCNQSISNSTTQHMKNSTKRSSSTTTQNTSNSNNPKTLYSWKHIVSMLERALHESKVVSSNEKNKAMDNNDEMNEGVNNNETAIDQQQRHPLFETLSFFSDESSLVLNPMILQTIKNRLVDRYCTVPR